MNAVETVSPDAKHILCVWYITRIISANCKAHFPAKERADADQHSETINWDDFSKVWSKLVVRTRDLSVFEENWSQLAGSIQSGAVAYTTNSQLADWKEVFYAPYLRDFMHFGSVTTSRVEVYHATLKR